MRARGAALRLGVFAAAILVSAVSAPAISYEAGPLGRWSLNGWTEGYWVLPTDFSTPRQLPEWITSLQVTGDVHPKVRIFLDARSLFGGPQIDPTGFGYVNLRDTFQNTSPQVTIDQGYVDVFLPSLDLRIGEQKLAWGKLDLFAPTDIVNPRRYSDPFVMSVEDQKIGIPAILASYYPPDLGSGWPQDLRASLLWVPLPVPPLFPLEQERWFPPAYQVPSMLTVPGSSLGPGLPDVKVTNSFTTANNPPAWQLDEGAVGLRLNGLWHGADWDLYYYNGLETGPAFAFTTTLTAPVPSQLFPCLLGATPGPCPLDSDIALRPTNGRIQLGGADVAFETHGFTIRAEGAFSANRFVPRSASELLSADNLANATRDDLAMIATELAAGNTVPINLGDLFVRRDLVQWGAAVDYHYLGWTPQLQVNQTVVLNNSAKLLINDVDTRLFFLLRKPFFAERLQTELGVVQGLERSYTSAGARLTYALTDHLRARVGALLIGGSRDTEIGQFSANDEFYFQVRYSF
ncbi:MAG TPA: DUF1302 family protein [Candidatus Dormibacteraeota bacterium]|nr:DUF1302 family protein [Candidatus Dormibacteraeota bacterium]